MILLVLGYMEPISAVGDRRKNNVLPKFREVEQASFKNMCPLVSPYDINRSLYVKTLRKACYGVAGWREAHAVCVPSTKDSPDRRHHEDDVHQSSIREMRRGSPLPAKGHKNIPDSFPADPGSTIMISDGALLAGGRVHIFSY